MEKKIRGSQERTLAGTTMRRSLERIIPEEDITTHFQPIADLHDETILGLEVLSRTKIPLSCPTELFRVAEALNLSWELESACSMEAFRGIADPRPVAGFAGSSVKALVIERCRIVIEVTEICRMSAYPSFAERMDQYVQQGFFFAYPSSNPPALVAQDAACAFGKN